MATAYTDISNVTFRNCYAYSCKNGIGVFHYDGNCEFKDILFDNIDIENFLGKYKDGRCEPTRAFFMEILNRYDGVDPVHDIPMGLIIGIVIGCIALGGGTIAALIVLKKRRA